MSFKGLKELIYSDLERVQTHNANSVWRRKILLLRYLITNESFKYCFWFRIASWLQYKRWCLPIYMISAFMHRHYTYKYGIQIPVGTSIEGGLSLKHFGAVVINRHTIIGKNCTIFYGVNCGLKMGGVNEGVPVIGHHCVLAPGCKIIGNVKIGNHVYVGANAVVTHDVPDNAVVAGVPAKIISMNGYEATELLRKHK